MVTWNKKFILVNGGTTTGVVMKIIVVTMVMLVFVVIFLNVVARPIQPFWRKFFQIGVHLCTLKKNLTYLTLSTTMMITTTITTTLSMTLG